VETKRLLEIQDTSVIFPSEHPHGILENIATQGEFHSILGGVNHCHLHCRLAKFRGLMRRVKYGAVIG
jgi:hypothetical protein